MTFWTIPTRDPDGDKPDANGAQSPPFLPPERPFGWVAVGIPITAPECEWLEPVLKILDQEPPFDELPDRFRQLVHATPDQPLGVLHSFSKREDRPDLRFRTWQPEPGSDRSVIDISSRGVDMGALAALIAITIPSAVVGGCGFPYTPVHDRTAPLDPRTMTGEPSGGLVSITQGRIEITDWTYPPDAGFGQWTYPTPP